MAASSIGSDLVALLALVIVCISALLILRYFLPLRSTPSFLLVPIFFSLVLPISTILLVPIDLASSTRGEDEAGRGIWLPQRAMLVAWRIAYWLMFALTWFILPLLGEYLDSGFRKPLDRFIYSLKSNGQFALIAIGCSALAAVYVLAQTGFKDASFKALVMALAYCVGLIQAIYMMGHGLVAIPRRLIRDADASGRLKRIHGQAPKMHEKMEDAAIELAELEEQLKQLRRKTDLSPDHRDWVEELVEITPITQSRGPRDRAFASTAPSPPSFITDRYLADLTRRLNRARHKSTRFVGEWEKLKQDARNVQAIIDAQVTQKLEFQRSTMPLARITQRFTILTPMLRYYLHAKILPVVRYALALIFALASVCIVWSELVKAAAPKLSVISLTVMHQTGDAGDVGFGGQVVTAMWIFYMCSAVLVSFGDVKVWGNRALVRRNTYGESACWYAGQLAKLTVPLAYNFLTFIPPGVHHKTTFYSFLGQLIDLTPLGDWFDNLFPILILLPICATLFNLYGRIKGVFRVDLVEDESGEDPASGPGGWREGRALIAADEDGRINIDSSNLLGGSVSPRAAPASGRGQREAPSLYIPPAEEGGASRAQIQAQRLSAATRAAEAEDEDLISGFAHRVKNTLDAVERPEWLNGLGKKPKWMNGPGNGESSSRPDSGGGLGRWFGGRPADGQVRL